MNKKNLITMCVAYIASVTLAGCNVGNAGNSTITANATNCTRIPANNNPQCKITLTYSSSVSGATLGVTPAPNAAFGGLSVAGCVAPTVNSQTCTISVNYTKPAGAPPSQSLTFTVSSVSSSAITVSGS